MQNEKRKIWVLIPIIIKNLLFIFFAWLKSIARKLGWKTITAILAAEARNLWKEGHELNLIFTTIIKKAKMTEDKKKIPI